MNKQELIKLIRANLKLLARTPNFVDTHNFIHNSSEEEFIIICTKSNPPRLDKKISTEIH